ncbi:MAG: recombination-associated protein RdgC, partial [Mariprofundus sp.]
MWFKNIHFYKFEDDFKLNAQQLHDKLEGRKARACGQMEMACMGWAKPLGRTGQMLVHDTDGSLMICLRHEDKVLPASLVREQVEEQAFNIEQEAGRPVGRKEKRDIKDQVLQELLPRALVRASHTFACILPKQGWLIVNASSASKSEELIETLRKTLGTLNVVLPATEESPESAMTRWLMNDSALPEGFDVEDECELHAGEGAEGVVRCKYIDVSSTEVRAHVASGRRVKKLALNWRERLSFVLHEDLSIRRMRFDSAILDEAGDSGDDEA